MKIKSTTKFMVIKKTFTKSNGKEYKKLVVLQDDTALTLGCDDVTWSMVAEYNDYTFVTEYNAEYKSFRIVGVIDTKSK